MTETNNPVKRRRVDSINSINFKRLVDEAAHEDEPTTTASTSFCNRIKFKANSI